jgi:hypothetical protein
VARHGYWEQDRQDKHPDLWDSSLALGYHLMSGDRQVRGQLSCM